MQSPHGFIVEPYNGKLYDNVHESGMVLSTSIDSYQTTNRIAVIKSLPVGYEGEIEIGALAIVHHNMFRKGHDMKGKEQFSASCLKGDTYLLEPYSMYAYKNTADQEWQTTGTWCFVEPVLNDDKLHVHTLKDLHGKVVYNNPILANEGVSVGDNVVFVTDSEYEFNIDGKTLYRIDSNDICLKQLQQKN